MMLARDSLTNELASLRQQNAELERRLANALADINTLRCMLKAPPVKHIEHALLPESPIISRLNYHVAVTSASGKPTLESMPEEVLDRIASFVDADSIMQLSHAVRYYKYISTAMYALKEDYNADEDWPEFVLPEFHPLDNYHDDNETFYTEKIFSVFTYCRVIQRNHGVLNVNLYPGWAVDHLKPFFTSNMSVAFHFRVDEHFLTLEKTACIGSALEALKGLPRIERLMRVELLAPTATLYAKPNVDWSALENLRIGSLGLHAASVTDGVLDKLKFVQGLQVLRFMQVKIVTSYDFMRDCADLEEVVFILPFLHVDSMSRLRNALKYSSIKLQRVTFSSLDASFEIQDFFTESATILEDIGWKCQTVDEFTTRWERM